MTFKRLSLSLLILLSLCFGCACNKHKKTKDVVQPGPVTSTEAQDNGFAFRLFAKMDKPGQNIFFSPYSISSALSMVYGGAEGKTAEQMALALSFQAPAEKQHAAFQVLQQELNAIQKREKAELNVANALFGSQKNEALLQKSYLKLLQESYASDLYTLNFGDAQGTADFINRWVEKKTKDKIKDLIKPGHISDSNDGLVLVNAIYFKGNWLNKFEPRNTHKDTFYSSSRQRTPETVRPVQMMYQRGKFPYAELPGYQILELPYAEEDLALLVVLPEEIDGIGKALDPTVFQAWQAELKTSEVKVFIPQFKLELTLEGLKDALKDMGMTDAFDPERADFSGIMQPNPGLFILDIVHKAFVEVKEEGTEAAAATGVVMATTSMPANPETIPVFRADHPFLYLILHKPTNTVLFLGKLADPPKL